MKSELEKQKTNYAYFNNPVMRRDMFRILVEAVTHYLEVYRRVWNLYIRIINYNTNK